MPKNKTDPKAIRFENTYPTSAEKKKTKKLNFKKREKKKKKKSTSGTGYNMYTRSFRVID